MNSATPRRKNPLSSVFNFARACPGLSYTGVKPSTQGYNGFGR
jgi:hypothetical protein